MNSTGDSRPPILEALTTLSDPTRCRILRTLDGQELQVSELCSVLLLPQSTVSRHLKVLSAGGWVKLRRDGNRHLYQRTTTAPPSAADGIWQLVRETLAEAPVSEEDDRRLAAVLASRREASRGFFSGAAGQWDSLRRDLFGERFDLLALLGLLDPRWVVGDLACGTGAVAEALAPCVHRVVGVDGSAAMLAAASRRLSALPSVELLLGEVEQLPLPDDHLDVALLFLNLHHLPQPGRALHEVARVLRPGGRVLVVDPVPHDREELRAEMGHVWLGFGAAQIAELMKAAGFEPTAYRVLPTEVGNRGPALFAAAGRRPSRTADGLEAAL